MGFIGVALLRELGVYWLLVIASRLRRGNPFPAFQNPQ